MRRILPPLSLTLFAAACVAPPPPAPRPAPVVRPAPVPPPAPVANWADRPIAPGTWRYSAEASGSIASYGRAGMPALFSIRCDRSASRIVLARPGSIATRMTLRATTATQVYSTVAMPNEGVVVAQASPRDPQLDAMAFSRGRMLIALDGASDLILPTWPEFARVIEDCR